MGGKSSGGKSSGSIMDLMKKSFNEGKPIRAGIKSNLLDILGGGSGAANLPMAQSAIAQSKDATAQTLKQIGNQEAGMNGVAGTPFGEEISSQARIAGNQATAGIPSKIAQFFLGTFGPPAAYGTQNAAVGFAGGAGQENAGKLGALGGLGQGVGSIIGKGGGSGIGKGAGSALGKSDAAGLDAALAAAL